MTPIGMQDASPVITNDVRPQSRRRLRRNVRRPAVAAGARLRSVPVDRERHRRRHDLRDRRRARELRASPAQRGPGRRGSDELLVDVEPDDRRPGHRRAVRVRAPLDRRPAARSLRKHGRATRRTHPAIPRRDPASRSSRTVPVPGSRSLPSRSTRSPPPPAGVRFRRFLRSRSAKRDRRRAIRRHLRRSRGLAAGRGERRPADGRPPWSERATPVLRHR